MSDEHVMESGRDHFADAVRDLELHIAALEKRVNMLETVQSKQLEEMWKLSLRLCYR